MSQVSYFAKAVKCMPNSDLPKCMQGEEKKEDLLLYPFHKQVFQINILKN